MSKGIVVFSGGLDSTTLLYELLNEGHELDAVSFSYGQRHVKELAYAKRTADRLGIRHDVVNLTGLSTLLAESGSSLVAGTDVPEGHYAQENMKATVVPNRNMIMLSIAGGIAVARKAEYIATAVHSGDHFIYPDCRPDFIEAMDDALQFGNRGLGGFKPDYPAVDTPFIDMSKAEIAYRAFELKVPLEETWSCYKGGNKHCGKCGTCVERLEAISEALNNLGGAGPFKDPTEYEDSEYWREAIRAHQA